MISTESHEFLNATKVSSSSTTRSASAFSIRKQRAQHGTPRKDRREHMFDNSEEIARSNGCVLYSYGLGKLAVGWSSNLRKLCPEDQEKCSHRLGLWLWLWLWL
jgi:hypothetical protein